jgi:hypothetical protein
LIRKLRASTSKNRRRKVSFKSFGISFEELYTMRSNARAYPASAGTFVSHWLLVRTEISHGAKLTYAKLAHKVDGRGIVRPDLAKIAAHLGNEVQHLMLFLIELEKVGLIEIQSPLFGPGSLCCSLPNHPWMDNSEPGKTNGPHDSAAPNEQPKPNGHPRDSNSKRQTNKFKRAEDATPGDRKSDDRQVSRPLSRFPYEICLEHAVKKREAGERVRSVTGLANHFYWTGEQDEEIAARL